MMHGFEERVVSFSWQYALVTYLEEYKHDQTNIDVLFDDIDDDLHYYFLNVNLEAHNRLGHDDLAWEKFINGMVNRVTSSVASIGEYLRFTLLRGVDPYSPFYMDFAGYDKNSCVIYLGSTEGFNR